MKKILIILFLFLLMPVLAINIVVQSTSNISKNSKNSEFSAKVIRGESFKNSYGFYQNDIIKGLITDYIEPKRAKRSAYIVVSPKTVYRNNTNLSYDYSNIEAKVIKYTKMDLKETGVKAGVSAGLKAGSNYIPGLSPIYYFTKGFIHPQKGEKRIASGAKSVYENSPLSYIEKGDDLHIKNGDYLTMKLYYKDVPKWRYFKRTK